MSFGGGICAAPRFALLEIEMSPLLQLSVQLSVLVFVIVEALSSPVPAMKLLWTTPVLELPINEPPSFAHALADRAEALFTLFKTNTSLVVGGCEPPPQRADASYEAWERDHLNDCFHAFQVGPPPLACGGSVRAPHSSPRTRTLYTRPIRLAPPIPPPPLPQQSQRPSMWEAEPAFRRLRQHAKMAAEVLVTQSGLEPPLVDTQGIFCWSSVLNQGSRHETHTHAGSPQSAVSAVNRGGGGAVVGSGGVVLTSRRRGQLTGLQCACSW